MGKKEAIVRDSCGVKMAFCQHHWLCEGKLGSSIMQAGNRHAGTCSPSARAAPWADAFKRRQTVTITRQQGTVRRKQDKVPLEGTMAQT